MKPVNFHPWEACIRRIRRTIDCQETSATFIMNVGMLWEFSLGCKQVSLIPDCYRVRNFIQCQWVGRTWRLDQRLRLVDGANSLLRQWEPGMWFLNNDVAWILWTLIRTALWIGKKLFTARLTISPECIHCGDMEEQISQSQCCASFLTLNSSRAEWKIILLEAGWVWRNVKP